MLLGCIWTLELRRYDSARNNSVAMRFGDVAFAIVYCVVRSSELACGARGY